MKKTIHRQDDTFVVEKRGYPYQVIPGMNDYESLMAYYKHHPEEFEEEYPAPPYEPTDEDLCMGYRTELTSTDWYIIREVDTGVECPTEIKERRAWLRAEIDKLEQKGIKDNDEND